MTEIFLCAHCEEKEFIGNLSAYSFMTKDRGKKTDAWAHRNALR